MKKFLAVLLALVMVLSLAACTGKGNTAAKGIDAVSVDDVISLFADMTDEEYGLSGFARQPVTKENASGFIGYEGFAGEFEEAEALVPMMNINPFVLVVFRLAEGTDSEAFANDIKKNANLEKWVCVSAETKEAFASGRTVVFFMGAKDLVEPLTNCFNEMTADGFVAEDHIKNPLKDLAMKDVYAKLYEMYSADNYGFMDNKDVTTLADVKAEESFGMAKLDSKNITDSVLDSGYAKKDKEADERAYVLSIIALKDGTDAKAFAEETLKNLDTSSLKGADVQSFAAYGKNVVLVFAGTGNYGVSSMSLQTDLSASYRMHVVSVDA